MLQQHDCFSVACVLFFAFWCSVPCLASWRKRCSGHFFCLLDLRTKAGARDSDVHVLDCFSFSFARVTTPLQMRFFFFGFSTRGETQAEKKVIFDATSTKPRQDSDAGLQLLRHSIQIEKRRREYQLCLDSDGQIATSPNERDVSILMRVASFVHERASSKPSRLRTRAITGRAASKLILVAWLQRDSDDSSPCVPPSNRAPISATLDRFHGDFSVYLLFLCFFMPLIIV